MRKKWSKRAVAVSVGAILCLATPAAALDFDFSGTFAKDNDVVLLRFTVGDTSTVTVFSSSWVDGGFDPILAIWDSAGDLLNQQDDGHETGQTDSNGISYSHGVWDSYFTTHLTAGNYTASIAQYDNFAYGLSGDYDYFAEISDGDSVNDNRPNLSDGFSFDGEKNAHFTAAWGSQDDFNGVWGSGSYVNGTWVYDDPRTGNWAFHILNVAAAQQEPRNDPVPEPGTLLLLGTGLIGLAGTARQTRPPRTAGVGAVA